VRSMKDGRIVASGTDTIVLPSDQTSGDGETTGPSSFHVQFELPDGDYTMRAVVREPGGLVGSADRRFTVRALDGPTVAASDLVLGARRGELPVRPTAYRGESLSGVLELGARTADRLARARGVVDVTEVGTAVPVLTTVAELEPAQTVEGAVVRTARVDLPVERLAPGAYIARAKVTMDDETLTETAREVEIVAGSRPMAKRVLV